MTSVAIPSGLAVRWSKSFQKSLQKLTAGENVRVLNAITTLQANPDSKGLKLRQLRRSSGAGPLWYARVSKDLRILLQISNGVANLVCVDHHDAAFLKALNINPKQPAPLPNGMPSSPTALASVLEPEATTQRHSKPAAPEAQTVESESQTAIPQASPLLSAWSVSELRDVLASRDVEDSSDNQLRALIEATEEDAEDVLLGSWPGDARAPLRADLLDLLLELQQMSPDEWREEQLTGAEEEAVRQFAEAITTQGATAALSIELDEEAVRRLAAAPIEDWMIFLHPSQREIVERKFRGAARVSGSAGTGKTTVALHRAAWLAKEPSQAGMFEGESLPILFTTYIKSLAPVLETLYGRLPAAVLKAVEFTHIDSLAAQLCKEAGELREVNSVQVGNMFAKAKKEVVRVDTPLHKLKLSDEYVQDEIRRVIVGRGIDDLETYLGIERFGREVRFLREVREQVWELHTRWRDLMDKSGLEHFEDRVRRARDYARALPTPRYKSVIVDEAQDLTQTGLELLVALVARRAPVNGGGDADLILGDDSLLIVGDVAQRVYPGGFTLREAGVNVRGRGVTLGHNYRNTRQIIEAAMACTGEQEVVDLDEDSEAETPVRRADAARESDREGLLPRLIIAAKADGEIRFVAEEIERLQASEALRSGDFGIFAATNKRVDTAIAVLEQAGFGCLNLKDFRGKSTDEIKVGTFDRAKGLEFKVVFLLGVSHGAWPFTAAPGLSPTERADAESLAASKLFVAMTRARDMLYVVCSQKPHQLIDAGRGHFGIVRA